MAHKTFMTIEKKESVEGCNGHERSYDELFDNKGNPKPLKKELLFYITFRGMLTRLCPGCLEVLQQKLNEGRKTT